MKQTGPELTRRVFPNEYARNPNGDDLQRLENMYLRVLIELSINRFKWNGLPDTVDARFIEQTLFYTALSVFYKDTEQVRKRNGKTVTIPGTDRYMCLQAARSGKVNMYNNPTEFTVRGNSMVQRTLNARECVPIWGNFLRVPDVDIVQMYAVRLAQIDRSIDIGLLSMRHPYVVVCDESERNTFANLLRNTQEGHPVIWGTSSLNLEKVQRIDIGVEKGTVADLQVAKSRIWNECMTLLGINNANQDKRERLVSSEVDANNEQVTASKATGLQSRQIACEQINRMFKKDGLNVSVEWNPAAIRQAESFVSGDE